MPLEPMTAHATQSNAPAAVQVDIRRIDGRPQLPLPAYATPEAAGMDLMAALDGAVTLAPGGRAAIPAGFAMALPQGYEAQIRPRSGLAIKHGLTVLNSPGTIDADYRGEVAVILINHGDKPFYIEPGMRIAQMIIAPVSRITWQETDVLSGTSRGGSGFGSTGTA